MSFTRKHIEVVSVEEMNKQLEYCRKYKNIINRAKLPNEFIGPANAYVEDKMTWFSLTFRKGTVTTTYKCRKDSVEAINEITGMDSYQQAQRFYKAKDFRDDERLRQQLLYNDDQGKFLCSAKPLLWKNEQYDGTRNYAYSYDINSSYSNAMLKDLPNTDIAYRSGFVQEGEIGFREDGKMNLTPVFSGYSLWIFPLMKSPYKRFVDLWYERKKTADTPEKRQKAKDMLNLCIGYFQRTNPFLRATIIYYANKEIETKIDNNTLYCNTDSIVSLSKVNVNIGKNIGEYKLEHEGLFAFKGFNYQWNYDTPSYRHIPKSWFKQGWDLLKDDLPKEGNIYEYKNYRLEKINYESKKRN